MIIAGAGSAGRETLGLYLSAGGTDIVLFDDKPETLEAFADKYDIVKTEEELRIAIAKNPNFCVSVGYPRLRERLFNRLIALGGLPKSIINPNFLYTLSEIPDNGTIIQPGVNISYGLTIGKSCMIHANSTIGHKVKIGNFVNVSPLCSIIGPCEIKDYSYIGAHSVVLPGTTIGHNAIIPAGSVVNRNVKDYETYGNS